LSRFCLDTSAYSWFRRGHRPVAELIDSATWLGVPTVTLGEIEVGFLLGGEQRRQRNRQELLEFLDHPVVEELPVTGEVALLYGNMVAGLRRAGTPVPTNDIWIAATAALAGSLVLTYDAHFSAIHGVGSRILAPP